MVGEDNNNGNLQDKKQSSTNSFPTSTTPHSTDNDTGVKDEEDKLDGLAVDKVRKEVSYSSSSDNKPKEDGGKSQDCGMNAVNVLLPDDDLMTIQQDDINLLLQGSHYDDDGEDSDDRISGNANENVNMMDEIKEANEVEDVTTKVNDDGPGEVTKDDSLSSKLRKRKTTILKGRNIKSSSQYLQEKASKVSQYKLPKVKSPNKCTVEIPNEKKSKSLQKLNSKAKNPKTSKEKKGTSKEGGTNFSSTSDMSSNVDQPVFTSPSTRLTKSNANKSSFTTPTASKHRTNRERIDSLWSERIKQLLRYKAEYGHTRVPRKSGSLGEWVRTQRRYYKIMKREGDENIPAQYRTRTPLTFERMQELHRIGFVWLPAEEKGGNPRGRTKRKYDEDEENNNNICTITGKKDNSNHGNSVIVQEDDVNMPLFQFPPTKKANIPATQRQYTTPELTTAYAQYNGAIDSYKTATHAVKVTKAALDEAQRAYQKALDEMEEVNKCIQKYSVDVLKAELADNAEDDWNVMYQRLVRYKELHGDILFPRGLSLEDDSNDGGGVDGYGSDNIDDGGRNGDMRNEDEKDLNETKISDRTKGFHDLTVNTHSPVAPLTGGDAENEDGCESATTNIDEEHINNNDAAAVDVPQDQDTSAATMNGNDKDGTIQEALLTSTATDELNKTQEESTKSISTNNVKTPKKETTESASELKELCQWVSKMRKYPKKQLKMWRREALDQLGFVWHQYDATWSERYKELVLYKEKYGNTLVPTSHTNLGVWVGTQRKQYKLMEQGKNSHMNPQRMEMLNRIGFTWQVNTWMERFQELSAFKTKHGHFLVPTDYPNRQLRPWITTQRSHYRFLQEGKTSQLTEERVQLLESIGFPWKTREDWQTRYEELAQYFSKTGNCEVPRAFSQFPKLYRWVNCQKMEFGKWIGGQNSRLKPEQVQLLNELNFVSACHNLNEVQ